MPRYRKKPIVFEAFQMTEDARRGLVALPTWLQDAWRLNPGHVGSLFLQDSRLRIRRPDGAITVDQDDYIIQGAEGEIYPCSPVVFEATYEAVEGEG